MWSFGGSLIGTRSQGSLRGAIRNGRKGRSANAGKDTSAKMRTLISVREHGASPFPANPRFRLNVSRVTARLNRTFFNILGTPRQTFVVFS